MIRFIKSRIINICYLSFFLLFILSVNEFAQQIKNHHELEGIINSDGSIKSGTTGSYNTKGYDIELGQNGRPLLKKSSLNKTLASSTAEWGSLGSGRRGITFYDGYPGNVYAIAINSEGDIYIGGEFGFVGDIIVANIAKWDVSESKWKVLPCGSANGVSGSVETIVINGTDVYVGGCFVNLADRTPVNYIAKFSEISNSWSALTDVDGHFSGVNFEPAAASEIGIYDMAFKESVLYVGGDFFKLGDGTTAATRVARWDGSHWSPLISGSINGVGSSSTSSYDFVDALEVYNNKVYVGGSFSTLGDGTTAAKNIAVWDEADDGADDDTWSPLSYGGINGVSGYVFDIKSCGTTVYVAGQFTKLGDGTSASGIAKWVEGSGWSSLISGTSHGVNNSVYTILVDETDVYFAGAFTQLDNSTGTFNHIAKWDGSGWSAVANSSNTIIGTAGPKELFALGLSGNNLYIGGVYMYLGDNSTVANSFAAWNKSTANWSTFGDGDNGVDGAVRSIVVDGDYVYAGGYFTSINGFTIPAKLTARFNYKTKVWSLLSSSSTGIDVTSSTKVYAMAVSGDYLYVAGSFNSINGGTTAKNIARYNLLDGTWSALTDGDGNTGVNNKIGTIAVHGDDIYVGGDFTALSGGTTANYTAKWNITSGSWSSITDGTTNGVGGRVLCSAINENLIYFGGNFSNLACWNMDTHAWVTLSDPDSYYPTLIRAIAINGSEIYIACDTFDGSVVKWDNTDGWTVLNADSKVPNPPIYSLAFIGNNLYATGAFNTLANSDFASGLVKWNSTDGWQTLTTAGSAATGIEGMGYYGYALAANISEKIMYIGGIFTTAGDKAAFNIASFNDSGNPALPVELISFTATAIDNGVGLKWSTATEVNNYGFEVERTSLKDTPGKVVWTKIGFVGGAGNSNSPKEYSFIDSNPVQGIVQYRLKQIDNDGMYKYYTDIAQINYLTGVKEKQIPKVFSLSQNYPNPFNPSTVISYQLPVNSNVTLKIYDVIGREVSTIVNGNQQPGYYNINFDGSRLAAGIYIYKLTAGKFVSTKKLMLIK